MRRRAGLAAALCALLIGVAGCGYYSTTSRGKSLKGTVAVPFLDNRTTQPDLEVNATEALIEALDSDGSLEVVPSGEEDYLLVGAVTRYTEAPFSINPEGVSDEYKLTIVVTLSFRDRRTGETIWSDNRFTGTENFFFEGSGAGEEFSRDGAEEKALEQITEDVLNAIFGEW